MLAAPNQPLPFSGKAATQGELDYAKWTQQTPHVVLSKSMNGPAWKSTRIVRELDQIGGGVATIREYLRERLVDRLHLAIAPLLLGSGEALFEGIDLVALGYRCTEHASGGQASHVVLSRSD